MRRIFNLLLSIVMLTSLVCPTAIMAETSQSYSNYDIIKEVARAYDRQEEQILYDQSYARRSIYASPEEATAQRTYYLDCSSFANSVYREAFGVNVMPYEINESVEGTSPTTKYMDAYARDNQDAVDVVGYWEPQTYTTDEERQEVVNWIYENIEIGDVIIYRHGQTESTKGHVYMYMGDKNFIHCRGAGSYTVNESNPALSYDNSAYEVSWGGTIQDIDASEIFEDPENTRYIFKATSSDTVWSFSLIRPLARELTPTEETINRMKIAGLSMEKTSSVWENSSVDTGDVLTYTVSMKNTNKTELSGVTISDTIPAGTEFVSGDEGVSVSGNALSWQGNIPASATVKVNYNVKITADTPGARIISDATYVSGVKLGNITHTVSECSKTQHTLIGEEAINCADSSKAYVDGIAFAKDIYKSVLGVEIFDYETAGAVLDDLVDETNKTCYTSTKVSKMIVPNMYGGLDIRYGRLYYPSEKDRVSLPLEENLSVGDIIIADWSGGSVTYVYAGNKKLVTVEDGVCKALTIGDNIYGEGQDNILISLIGYDRYAVLRPVSAITPAADIEAIEISTPPTKVNYNSGESFDNSGMVVKAVMSNGSRVEIEGYTVSPSVLRYPMSSVNVYFNGLTAQQSITVTESPKDIWDGTVATGFASGNGTEKDPYIISNAAELAYLASSTYNALSTSTAAPVSATETDTAGIYNAYKDVYFKLTADIDLNNKKWLPIGRFGMRFDGNFDGGGHNIKNLKITNAYYGIGLFGATGKDVSISNLGIDTATLAYAVSTSSSLVVKDKPVTDGDKSYSLYAEGTETRPYGTGVLVGIFAGGTFEDCFARNVTMTLSGNVVQKAVGGLLGVAYCTTPYSTHPSEYVDATRCYVNGFTLTREKNIMSLGAFAGSGRPGGTANKNGCRMRFTDCYVADIDLTSNSNNTYVFADASYTMNSKFKNCYATDTTNKANTRTYLQPTDDGDGTEDIAVTIADLTRIASGLVKGDGAFCLDNDDKNINNGYPVLGREVSWTAGMSPRSFYKVAGYAVVNGTVTGVSIIQSDITVSGEVIVAVYDGERFINAVTAIAKNGTIAFDTPVEVSEGNTVKVFVWSSFKDITPMSDIYSGIIGSETTE